MKYIKTYEISLHSFKFYDDINYFVDWFYDFYAEDMFDEGWIISDCSDAWQIQKNDDYNILNDDYDAYSIAEKHGLMLNKSGEIIGYKDISFIDNPEDLEYYKSEECKKEREKQIEFRKNIKNFNL